VQNQEQLDELSRILEIVSSEHSFIREIYLEAPSYIQADRLATVSPDMPPAAKILISIPSNEVKGLELTFKEIEEFSISFDCELRPRIKPTNEGIVFSFNENIPLTIKAKTLTFRILGEEARGHHTLYGKEEMFDKTGSLVEP
jgi:hypothetical protein